jgi:hypothetical protein
MRKSARIRELELKVAQMEVYVELIAITLENIMQGQQMNIESDLDSGKWYNTQEEGIDN